MWKRVISAVIALSAVGFGLARVGSGQAPPRQPSATPAAAEASAKDVHTFCGLCHAYPPPESFPRSAWREEVRKGYDFFRDANLRHEAPDLESVVSYYEKRAPQQLPAAPREPLSRKPLPGVFAPQGLRPPDCPAVPGVTNVHVAPLFHKDKQDLIVCHTNPGRIW